MDCDLSISFCLNFLIQHWKQLGDLWPLTPRAPMWICYSLFVCQRLWCLASLCAVVCCIEAFYIVSSFLSIANVSRLELRGKLEKNRCWRSAGACILYMSASARAHQHLFPIWRLFSQFIDQYIVYINVLCLYCAVSPQITVVDIRLFWNAFY